MERELLRLSETPLHLEKTWESGGVPVLTAEVTLPCCGGKEPPCAALRPLLPPIRARLS
ncbi:MAG: hypothetical protein ACLR77_07935 [Oscillospiraceae bacterium]